jgi:hypothetical protein
MQYNLGLGRYGGSRGYLATGPGGRPTWLPEAPV